MPHTRGPLYCLVESHLTFIHSCDIKMLTWHWVLGVLSGVYCKYPSTTLIRSWCSDCFLQSETFRETDIDRLIFQTICLLCLQNKSSSAVLCCKYGIVLFSKCIGLYMQVWIQVLSEHIIWSSFSRLQHKSIHLELLWCDIQRDQDD